jgi:hypothetical protein
MAKVIKTCVVSSTLFGRPALFQGSGIFENVLRRRTPIHSRVKEQHCLIQPCSNRKLKKKFATYCIIFSYKLLKIVKNH